MQEAEVYRNGPFCVTTQRLIIRDKVIPIESIKFTHTSVRREWFLVFLFFVVLVISTIPESIWWNLSGLAVAGWLAVSSYRNIIRSPERELHIELLSGESESLPTTNKKFLEDFEDAIRRAMHVNQQEKLRSLNADLDSLSHVND